MPRTSTAPKAKKAVTTAPQEEETLETFSKNKKPIEIEEPETALSMDDKDDDENAPREEGDDDLGEEAVMDDEDFGDRWEE